MKDDFEINRLMRKKFKGEKVILEAQEKRDKEVKNFALELEPLTA